MNKGRALFRAVAEAARVVRRCMSRCLSIDFVRRHPCPPHRVRPGFLPCC